MITKEICDKMLAEEQAKKQKNMEKAAETRRLKKEAKEAVNIWGAIKFKYLDTYWVLILCR